MTVRSEQLALGTESTANSYRTIYTCPADRRTILKTAWLFNAQNAALTLYLNILHGGVATDLRTKVLAIGETWDLTTWGVLEAGDELRVYGTPASGAMTLRYWLSGSELDLTP